MMKRFVYYLCALLSMLALLVAGCGQDKAEKETLSINERITSLFYISNQSADVLLHKDKRIKILSRTIITVKIIHNLNRL